MQEEVKEEMYGEQPQYMYNENGFFVSRTHFQKQQRRIAIYDKKEDLHILYLYVYHSYSSFVGY